MPKALVVDDSIVIRKMVGKILSENGHEYVQAENGQEALEIFESQDFNIVITDINMPIMNGFELASAIRKSSNGHSNIPIIVLSTEFSDEVKAEGKKIGVNAWMIKPCDEDKLVAAISQLCN